MTLCVSAWCVCSDMGIAKDGTVKDEFARGYALLAKQTVFAEGCRGSCSEAVMEKYNLRENSDPQTYGLGVKEVWEVPADKFKSGFNQHTIGCVCGCAAQWSLYHRSPGAGCWYDCIPGGHSSRTRTAARSCTTWSPTSWCAALWWG